jgi:hypothetical protein
MLDIYYSTEAQGEDFTFETLSYTLEQSSCMLEKSMCMLAQSMYMIEPFICGCSLEIACLFLAYKQDILWNKIT